MPKKKKDIFTREKEYKNQPKDDIDRKTDKETPGVSGKHSGR